MSKVAGVAIDNWKLSIFKKHLDAAGYTYEPPKPFTEGTMLLRVNYRWVHELQPIIEAAERECRRSKPK